MTHPLFTKHEATLNQALATIATRGYWTPFPEMPSPKVYGETANPDGEAAFKAHLNRTFDLDQPTSGETVGNERSPFGIALGIRYPEVSVDTLLAASVAAQDQWRAAGPDAWAGVSLEILTRLNKASFEIGYSVMHTTGQAFMMAFQAGGPHAQDRALERVRVIRRARIVEREALLKIFGPALQRWLQPIGLHHVARRLAADPLERRKHVLVDDLRGGAGENELRRMRRCRVA